MRKPTAKSLILDLLLAFEGQPLSAKQAIAACRIFDISVNNTRVALVRLSAEGLIESAGRAMYQLSTDAHRLADDVASWRSRSQRLRPWNGDYVILQAEKLTRSEAKAKRARERALQMTGFQPLNDSLYVRPNNIEESVEALRQRLHKLGLEPETLVFQASQFSSEIESSLIKKWNPAELGNTYANLSAKMATWLSRHRELEVEVAARESFILGGSAIKHVVYDPFLPSEWIDVSQRERFIDMVHRVDAAGKKIWTSLWATMDT